MYQYRLVSVTKVVDGDTVEVIMDLGCHVCIAVKLRLAHINAPEMSTPQGPVAKQFVEQWFYAHDLLRDVFITTSKDRQEKYGRWLAVIGIADLTVKTLNQELLDRGLAVKYEG